MSAVYIHLVINHFPIMLAMVGAAAVIAALIFQRRWIWRYACLTMILAGLSAIPVYISGDEAGEEVEDIPHIHRHDIEEHQDAATWALVALLLAGASAAVAWGRPGKSTRGVFVVLTLAGAGLVANAGLHGGEIVHGNLELGAPEAIIRARGGAPERGEQGSAGGQVRRPGAAAGEPATSPAPGEARPPTRADTVPPPR